MGIYKQGLNRKQQLMFPPSLDELVEEDNVVRAIEAYVDTLEKLLLILYSVSGVEYLLMIKL